MAYSELIKSFEKIREYVSQFYVFGFKSRSEYTSKSARSYDNERRRIESWLGDYMQFRHEKGAKNSFLALDTRSVSHNPLYNAFKAKSFTDNDINLHFYIFDILAEGCEKSFRQILDCISEDYLAVFDIDGEADESTVRKKLREYEKLGLIKSRKQGRELLYSRCDDIADLDSWQDAAAFYSEEDALGAVGSFLLDKFDSPPDYFSFKHHYILHALESEILEQLFEAMREQKSAELTIYIPRSDNIRIHNLLPLKIYCSTQSGRRYLLGYHYRLRRMTFFRLDNIKKVKLLKKDDNYEKHFENAEKYKRNLWGVASTSARGTDHIEMTVYVADGEEYIIRRLDREKRYGRVDALDSHHFRFVADVYDATEMLPWIRTFTGRIEKLECSNKAVTETFFGDFDDMLAMYGGDGNAV
ncbi:MAG: WYL domain-containing protein [Ruminococcaceae bacterium]|nr:WYL domain-containing protein [Oscillospiraceae bacterium]